MTLAHPDDAMTGLEDFAPEDLVMPALRIDHQAGVIKHSLSGEEFKELDTILLGLVKQRTLWAPDMAAEPEAPICRSLNFTTGIPDPQKPERFPWKAAGVDEAPAISCEGCQLKEWGSHPKNSSPWCSEQWVFPLMFKSGSTWSPATITLQRVNLKPARGYVSAFAAEKSGLYVCTTKLTCHQNKRGTVSFVTLSFAKGDATPEDSWPELIEQYRRTRQFLQTPRSTDEEVTEPGDAAPKAPPKKAAAAVDEEEIDF